MKNSIKTTIKDFLEERKSYTNHIKEQKSLKERLKLRLPNILTLVRLIAPFITVPIACSGNFILALVLNGVAASSDAFDGFFARKWNATSEYGRKLDPICDKVFAIGLALPMLPHLGFTLPIIALETVIATISCHSLAKKNHPASSKLGKFKTIILSLFLASMYLVKGLGMPIMNLLPGLIVTNIFQVATAIEYYKKDKAEDILKAEEIRKAQLEETKQEEIVTHEHTRDLEYQVEIKPTDNAIEQGPKVKTLGTYPKRN